MSTSPDAGGAGSAPETAKFEISYSKISAYRFCPWKYKLVYVDGRMAPPNPHSALGQSVHRALEAYHKSLGPGASGELDALFEAYDTCWVNEGFATPQQTLQFYEKGKRMLERYHAWSLARKSEVVALEKEFSMPAGERVLRGIVDRVDRLPDGSYEVIDYKTHAEMWEDARVASDLQLTLYARGCREALGFKPLRLGYYFLAHDRFVPTARTEAQEAEALREASAVADRIEAKDFPPDTSACPKCDFRALCRYSTARPLPPAAKEKP